MSAAARLVVLGPQDRQRWDAFVQGSARPHFCQGWGFGAARESLGFRRVVLGVELDGELVAGAQMLRQRWPLVPLCLAYVPRGCVLTPGAGARELGLLGDGLARHAHAWGATAVRSDPDLTPEDHDGLAALAALGLRPSTWDGSPLGLQPRAVFRIDLQRDEEAIFASFHRMKRRCIRKARKQGVEVTERADEEALEVFLRLHAMTLARQRYLRLPEAYFLALHRELVAGGQSSFFLSGRAARPCAALWICRFGGRSWYLYGGFDHGARELNAPHLAMWEAIRAAHRRGDHWFDLRGTGAGPGEAMHAGHRLHGLHRFKLQFAPREFRFVSEHERICHPARAVALRLALPVMTLAMRAAKGLAAWRYR